MKSALMSTAGPSFADTALTQEASVLVEGAGLVNVGAADRPLVFTDPQSLSFGYLDARRGREQQDDPDHRLGRRRRRRNLVGGDPAAGRVGRRDHRSRAGHAQPRGHGVVQIVARASAGALQGDNFGFVVLRRGSDVRRIPYAFSVTRLVS